LFYSTFTHVLFYRILTLASHCGWLLEEMDGWMERFVTIFKMFVVVTDTSQLQEFSLLVLVQMSNVLAMAGTGQNIGREGML